jgi:hypothetical protein
VARSSDAGRLERLLRAGTSQRLGFVPRNPGSLGIRFRLGWRKPENHRILSHGPRAVGYANLADDSSWNLTTNEVVLSSPAHIGPMVGALEGLARGRWLTFQGTSFVRDAEATLLERKYSVLPSSHGVLMAKGLGATDSRGEDLRGIFDDPLFSSHRGDMF